MACEHVIVDLDTTLVKTSVETVKHPGLSSVYTVSDEFVPVQDICESTQVVGKVQTQHGLVNAFLTAYNNHQDLVLRPDDIQNCLQMVYSTLINANPEKYRVIFTDSQEKQQLNVEHDQLDFAKFSSLMREKIRENIKSKRFVDVFATEFSTTTPLTATVSNMMLMNSLKEYFSFGFMLGCGFPRVIMQGTLEDWTRLQQNYNSLKELSAKREADNENYQLWTEKMDLVMNLFMMMYRGQNVEYVKKIWQYAISLVPQGSGGQKYLGGWIHVLAPLSGTNKFKDFNKMVCLVGPDQEFPELPNKIDPETGREIGMYAYQDVLREFFSASDFDYFQNSMFETPATLSYPDGTTRQLKLFAGLDHHPIFNTETSTVSTNYHCQIMGNNLEWVDPKPKWFDMGITIEKKEARLPRDLKLTPQQTQQMVKDLGVNYAARW